MTKSFFVIQNNGSKFFRYDYTFNKKRKPMFFDGYPIWESYFY